jgi:hypothetical protein
MAKIDRNRLQAAASTGIARFLLERAGPVGRYANSIPAASLGDPQAYAPLRPGRIRFATDESGEPCIVMRAADLGTIIRQAARAR